MKKRITAQQLSQLDDHFSDYAKQVSKVFIGKGLHMPGIKKSPKLPADYAEYLLTDMRDTVDLMSKLITSFKSYLRTSNPAHAERIKDLLSMLRQITTEMEARIIEENG